MAPTTCVLLVALVLLQGGSPALGEDIEANINKLTENIVGALKDFLPKLNLTSISIPTIQHPIDILFLKNVNLIATDGVVTNFGDLSRYNEELLTYHVDNHDLSLRFGVAVNDLKVEAKATVGTVIKNLLLDVEMKGTNVVVGITVNLETLKLTANEVKVDDVGNISVSAPETNFIINTLLGLIPNLVSGLVKTQVNDNGKAALQGIFDIIDLNGLLKPPASLL